MREGGTKSRWNSPDGALFELLVSQNRVELDSPDSLVGLLALLLAYPLALLLIKSFVISRPGQANVWAIKGWVEAFTDPNLALAIGNTFYLAFVRVVVTTILAIFFAWLVTRTDIPLKSFIELTLWLGFFLTPASHDNGLDYAFGSL